jgi:hypothetical protein
VDGGGASGLRERRGRSDRVLGRLLAVETQGLRLVFGAALAGVVYDVAVVQARGQAQRREGLTMVGYDEVVEELRALRGGWQPWRQSRRADHASVLGSPVVSPCGMDVDETLSKPAICAVGRSARRLTRDRSHRARAAATRSRIGQSVRPSLARYPALRRESTPSSRTVP